MLSAFAARPIVELKPRDKAKIESILAYGDRVLVGLNTGALRIYRVHDLRDEGEGEGNRGSNANGSKNGDSESNDDGNSNRNDNGNSNHSDDAHTTASEHTPASDEAATSTAPTRPPSELLREEERFSRRPIQQLAVIKEAGLLVSLSDSVVSLHDMHTYALQARLDTTRGATAFAAASNIVKDAATGIPCIVSRLAVAVRRRVLLWTWQDTEGPSAGVDVALSAPVRSVTWASGSALVVGMDAGFVYVDVVTGEVRDIIKSGARFGAVAASGMGYMAMASWAPRPMATRLGQGELLLARDVHSLFISDAGHALDRRPVPWQAAPDALAYSYPYLLSLAAPAKGSLDVRNPNTLSLLQSIALPGASLLHVPQPTISLAHAGKGFLVTSERCIWRMDAQGYAAQLDELARHGRYDEALSLLAMLEDTLLLDKAERQREMRMCKAHALFDQGQFQEAMELFTDARAPPARVIALYPPSIAGALAREESVQAEGSVVDEQRETTAADTTDVDASEPAPAAVTTIGRSMMGRLVGHKKPETDAASLRASSLKDDATETSSMNKTVTEKDYVNSVRSLQQFLAQCRVQIKRYIDTDGNLKEPLPTSSSSDVEPEIPPFHFLIPQSAHVGDVDWKQQLLAVAQLVDTALFRAYMIASPSLAGSLFRLPNFCEPDVVQEKLYETGRYADLIDFLHGKRLHRQALELLAKFGKNEAHEQIAPALQGPQRTVGYLQQLSPDMIDLILEFAAWPLRTDENLGMQVFIADTENAESLPRQVVLEFLERINVKLAITYLEHVIEELDDLNPLFHQRLVDLLLERLRSGDFEGGEEARHAWRERLQRFLRTSANYNKSRVFQQLPANDADYYEARAIVLSKMGQHKQALAIYVFQVKDYHKAEEYCNQIYITATPTERPVIASKTMSSSAPLCTIEDAEPSIYHILLALYLTPPPPHKPNWPPALELVSKHGARLPASTTLDLIPPTLPVRDLQSYFFGRIRAANSSLNSERIVAQLQGVKKAAVEAAVVLGENKGTGRVEPGGLNRRVVVDQDRHCAVCHKRFGRSAIRVYPDNSVVHSGCQRGSVGKAEKGGDGSTGWR